MRGGLKMDSNFSLIFNEYMYRRLSEISDEQEQVVLSIRLKKGILILSDRLRALEVEKCHLIRVYEDLRPFL